VVRYTLFDDQAPFFCRGISDKITGCDRTLNLTTRGEMTRSNHDHCAVTKIPCTHLNSPRNCDDRSPKSFPECRRSPQSMAFPDDRSPEQSRKNSPQGGRCSRHARKKPLSRSKKSASGGSDFRLYRHSPNQAFPPSCIAFCYEEPQPSEKRVGIRQLSPIRKAPCRVPRPTFCATVAPSCRQQFSRRRHTLFFLTRVHRSPCSPVCSPLSSPIRE